PTGPPRASLPLVTPSLPSSLPLPVLAPLASRLAETGTRRELRLDAVQAGEKFLAELTCPLHFARDGASHRVPFPPGQRPVEFLEQLLQGLLELLEIAADEQ